MYLAAAGAIYKGQKELREMYTEFSNRCSENLLLKNYSMIAKETLSDHIRIKAGKIENAWEGFSLSMAIFYLAALRIRGDLEGQKKFFSSCSLSVKRDILRGFCMYYTREQNLGSPNIFIELFTPEVCKEVGFKELEHMFWLFPNTQTEMKHLFQLLYKLEVLNDRLLAQWGQDSLLGFYVREDESKVFLKLIRTEVIPSNKVNKILPQIIFSKDLKHNFEFMMERQLQQELLSLCIEKTLNYRPDINVDQIEQAMKKLAPNTELTIVYSPETAKILDILRARGSI